VLLTRHRSFALLGALSVLLLLAVPAVAWAQSAPLSSPDPQVWVTNGGVLTTAIAPDGTNYIGGSFSYVGPKTGCGVAVNATNGTVQTAFPEVQGPVCAVAPDGSGGFYVGGHFSSVGGVACKNVVHILAGGSLDTTFDANASASDEVYALAVSGSTLYVGGSFDTIGGQARNHVAALDTTSGDATTWNPGADGTVYALAVSGSTVYAGGEFTTIGGQSSNHLAALDATSGAADTTFAANASANNDILALAVSDSTVYAGGAFTTIGGQSSNYLAALDATSGAPDTTFDANASAGGDIYALAVSGSTLYVGGHFNTIGGQPRNNVAALDATSGDATTWNPDAGSDIEALAVSGSTVYVGGYFGSIGVQARYNNFFGLACFSPTPALNNLTVSAGSLSPAFASGTLSYTDSVANGVTSLTVTPTADDSHASYRLRVGGVTVSNPIALSVGNTTIDIVVSAQNGPDQTYVLTVTRAPSGDAGLSNLTVSAGSLSPAFASGTLSYTDSVANGVTSLTVTPTADDSHASYRLRVGGVTVSNPIALSVGNTTIDIVVSAQDGVTDQTYVLTVTRATLITPHVTLTLSGLKGGAVKLGKRLTVKGTVKPSSLAGGKVSLTVQRKVGAKWRKVKTMTAKIATGGAYRCTYGPTKKGSYRIRVTFARTAANTAAATAWKAFRVK